MPKMTAYEVSAVAQGVSLTLYEKNEYIAYRKHQLKIKDIMPIY